MGRYSLIYFIKNELREATQWWLSFGIFCAPIVGVLALLYFIVQGTGCAPAVVHHRITEDEVFKCVREFDLVDRGLRYELSDKCAAILGSL